MPRIQHLLLIAFLSLALVTTGKLLFATHVSYAASAFTQQPQPTVAPSATQSSGRRERIEAPPLRPQAAALLIGANLVLGVGIVVFAFLWRRRNQRKGSQQ